MAAAILDKTSKPFAVPFFLNNRIFIQKPGTLFYSETFFLRRIIIETEQAIEYTSRKWTYGTRKYMKDHNLINMHFCDVIQYISQ